jgi:hypothetical protein
MNRRPNNAARSLNRGQPPITLGDAFSVVTMFLQHLIHCVGG